MTVATTPARTEELLRLLGDPTRVLAELQQSQQSLDVLADERRLVVQYPEKWIAVHAGSVIAESDTLEELLATVDVRHPGSRSHSLIRYVERDERTLILQHRC